MVYDWAKQEARRLIDLAFLVNPEGEPLDLIDNEYTTQQMAELRSHLSSMRSGLDAVNGALARAWETEHLGESYADGTNRWWVGRAKKKEWIKDAGFHDWLATLDADRLATLINPNTIKVGGLTPAERETFFDESQRTDRLSIQSKPIDLDA